jgi:threonine synthase
VHLEGVEEMNEPNAFINKEDGLVCAKCFKPFTEEWQYLTDDEIKEIVGGYSSKDGIGNYTRTLIDKIEAKIKEKNFDS